MDGFGYPVGEQPDLQRGRQHVLEPQLHRSAAVVLEQDRVAVTAEPLRSGTRLARDTEAPADTGADLQ